MSMTPDGIEARLRTLAEELASRSGYELVDLEYKREPTGWMVRLFIDRQGGVTLEDCQRVSQEFGTTLEVEDPIPHPFHLEVSSPGLDRPLRKQADYLAAVGRKVRLQLRQPLNGRRHFAGRLEKADEALETGFGLHLRDDSGTQHVIPADTVDKAHIVYEWPELTSQGLRKGRRPGKKR
ncbi:MAG: ribosome maturation factor RimP [Candidatus Polarisedimenticolia bacterium]